MKNQYHGAGWHKDVDTKFGTVCITLSGNADDGVIIDPICSDKPDHKKAKVYNVQKTDAVAFLSRVWHTVPAKTRNEQRCVLSIFF